MFQMPRATHRVLSFFLFSVLSLHAAVFAAENDFTSKTYLKFYQDARDNRYTPLYEYIELESRNLQNGQVNLYLSGWLGHDFETQQFENKTRDELTYAFLRYSPYADRRLLLTAGRQFVFEGIASEQIDGIATRWEFTPRTGVSLFGGVPVETEFDSRRGDAVFGGRIFQRIQSRGELGVSVLAESNDGNRFREEGGLDIWLLPVKKVEVKGQSSYNNITDGWREHSYNLRIFPVERLILSALFVQSRYDDAFSARTLSVFSPDLLGPGEQLTKAGGTVDYRVNDSLSGVVDYARYAYKIMGDAGYYGVKVSATVRGVLTGLSFHRMEGPVDKLRYIEARAYATTKLEKWRLSLDAINLNYDSAFNNLKNAYSLNGTVRYTINDSLTSGFSIDYSKTPDFINNTTALLNLVYGYKGGK
jgi:hypothetical protein